jgi:serine/threonine protein kinase
MAAADEGKDSLEIVRRWCEWKGAGWHLRTALGQGGTAPVYEVASPDGPRALKIYSPQFSTGEAGELEEKRIEQQLSLKRHNCPQLVEIHDGGRFEDRLFLLMGRAPGGELEKRLSIVPRAQIRHVVDQVARAAIFLRERGLCHRDIKSANIFISDDFSKVTLLDISVIRDIYDPLGIGTDRDGQLPVVATARYSPPEYLFRLIDPGPDLWHALNVYQLSALLHDLIMREPLFQAEYAQSKQNRYRFAWVAATSVPLVVATDVDQDLILAAHRGLDKEWKRRSSLTLEDFLAEPGARKARALQVLGVARPRHTLPEESLAATTARLSAIARVLDEATVGYLRENGVTPKHFVEPATDDASTLVRVSWTSFDVSVNQTRATQLVFKPTIHVRSDVRFIALSVELQSSCAGAARSAAMEIPELQDTAAADDILASNAVSALEKLAIKIADAGTTKEGDD